MQEYWFVGAGINLFRRAVGRHGTSALISAVTKNPETF
jgi:hypothetical protein